MPVYNGERWITAKLATLTALDYPADRIDILVLDDGSSDATVAVARKAAAGDPRIQIIPLPHAGKAAGLNAGLLRATGEILFFTDVRQTLEPGALRHLTACFSDPQVGVASGELVICDGNTREEVSVGLYWRYEKLIRKNLSRIDSVLGATGAIYAMRRSLAKPIPPGTLLDDVYLPLVAFFAGYRVVFEERAIAWDFPTSLKTEFRRKVRTQAGVYQIIGFFPALLNPAKNRLFIDFASHKLGRLLLPWALLLAAVATFGMPSPLRELCLAAQAAVYLTAAVDDYLPDGFPLKRLSSPVRTFVTLMIAAFCAVSIFFRSSDQFWKQATGSSSSATPVT
jgi:cellulose synthase/poly-beta-1,6-N-acetylglucosamine synthase-like glycosyltransferase